MKDGAVDPKQKAILKAAWNAFAAYGFRKTSMDDIARGASMSRPALYLHYRNKEDIFRSLAQFYYDDAVEEVRQALSRDAPVAEILADAFVKQGGSIKEAMLTSPHGLELIDTGNVIAADIAEDGEARLTEIYADWLQREAKVGRVTLTAPAQDMAAMFTTALKGFKQVGEYEAFRSHVDHFAALSAAGLTARSAC
ncbi:TetR/AcrR family transcriptional regulator [Thalassococcus sp. S3]|uniref:TetR/AcrR family transcriptional regulator n=1 Tax=Thalassococcus sp. S3 TaxID=2017482 RepID=UPI0010246487|nr:TetR/AcrR family transcriptional regulator [Thalassococcus sp. S3]QBF31290.1 TetR family transcriptional regulator [Thalassococcus sp. S3]